MIPLLLFITGNSLTDMILISIISLQVRTVKQKLNKKLERKNDMKRPDMIDRNQKLKVIIFWKYVMYVLGRIVILKDKSYIYI